MNALLIRSVQLYERLLRLYPRELRREFGSEMILAFADDLEAAWSDARIAGVAQIWWYALREMVTVALPGQRSNPSIIVPAWSFAVTALTQSAEVWIGTHQGQRVEYPSLLSSILLVVMPSLLNAFVALIVTRFYASRSITVLRLD
jgi:hypothetical protein